MSFEPGYGPYGVDGPIRREDYDTKPYPLPHEGVVGTLRDQDDLLSLDDKAAPRREMMIGLARCLCSAVLVGNPCPAIAEMWKRMDNPQIGDLVLETGRHHDYQGFGILIACRYEWAHTEEEWRQHQTEVIAEAEACGLTGWDEPRRKDDAWYVQYGPSPADICRWTNCTFITVPTDRYFPKVAATQAVVDMNS